MRGTPLRRAVVIVALAIVSFTTAADVAARSNGFGERAAAGCGGQGCHGLQPATNIVATLDAPPQYVPNLTYTLKVGIAGALPTVPVQQNLGGFALAASAGLFHVPTGETSYQIQSGAATHTAAGNDQREWSVHWSSPAPGTGEVTFSLSVNAVDGNGLADPGDQWNMRTLTIREDTDATPAGGEHDGAGGNTTDANHTDDGHNDTRTPGIDAYVLLTGAGAVAVVLAAATTRRRGG